MKKTIALGLCVAAAAYLFGVLSYARQIWPANVLQSGLHAAIDKGTYDASGRLVAYPGKQEVPCPAQTASTGVLLVAGQSNAANKAEAHVSTAYPTQVLQYFGGKCYVAASPLLGASHEDGEFLTLLGDDLVRSGVFRQVVIAIHGMDGSQIARWQEGGDLSERLLSDLRTMPYKPSAIVWHQGETDFFLNVSERVYTDSFRSMLASLRSAGVDAPIFLAIATKCGTLKRWRTDNPVARAQRALVDGRSVFLGADTDAILNPEDRRSKDACHFSESGQRKVAAAYAESIVHALSGHQVVAQ